MAPGEWTLFRRPRDHSGVHQTCSRPGPGRPTRGRAGRAGPPRARGPHAGVHPRPLDPRRPHHQAFNRDALAGAAPTPQPETPQAPGPGPGVSAETGEPGEDGTDGTDGDGERRRGFTRRFVRNRVVGRGQSLREDPHPSRTRPRSPPPATRARSPAPRTDGKSPASTTPWPTTGPPSPTTPTARHRNPTTPSRACPNPPGPAVNAATRRPGAPAAVRSAVSG